MSRFTRRQFVQGSVAAGAALGVGFTPWRRALGANEEIRVAVIGSGFSGTFDTRR